MSHKQRARRKLEALHITRWLNMLHKLRMMFARHKLHPELRLHALHVQNVVQMLRVHNPPWRRTPAVVAAAALCAPRAVAATSLPPLRGDGAGSEAPAARGRSVYIDMGAVNPP